MNTDFNLSELFDRYLENDLNFLERQDFEQQLKTNQAFAERFRLHKEVDEALIEEDILNFRLQLEKIGINNSKLIQSAPMIIADEIPDIDNAILEQDVMALRDQLSRIHTSVAEEIDPVMIPGYQGIERAILNQDPTALNRELNAFDELVMSDSSEDEAFMAELSQEIDRAIMQEDVLALRSVLDEIGQRAIPSKRVIPLRKKVLAITSTAVAAVFICVFAGTMLLNNTAGSLTSERTFSKYFQPYEGIGTKRGASDDTNQYIELAFHQYNSSQFADALPLFEACLNDPANEARREVLALFAGSSAMQTGDIDKAIGYFENWDSNSPNINQVEWYLIGCYLRKGDLDKAKSLATKVSQESDHSFKSNAGTLLKKFGKNK